MRCINMQENADYDTRCKENQKWLNTLYFCPLTFISRSGSLAYHLHYYSEIKRMAKGKTLYFQMSRVQSEVRRETR